MNCYSSVNDSHLFIASSLADVIVRHRIPRSNPVTSVTQFWGEISIRCPQIWVKVCQVTLKAMCFVLLAQCSLVCAVKRHCQLFFITSRGALSVLIKAVKYKALLPCIQNKSACMYIVITP